MSTSVRGSVSVSCSIPLNVFERYPVLTNSVLRHIVACELAAPLRIDNDFSPTQISLTTERLKQAIKENCTREELREYKDTGKLSEESLAGLVKLLSPLEEMLHFFWKRVRMERDVKRDILWCDSDVLVTNEKLPARRLRFTHYFK